MLIYQVFIAVYQFAFRFYARFNAKARAGLEGRLGLFDRLQAAIPTDKQVIWFHCASLGEFEQGRPLIEQLKSGNQDLFILLTFFSTSGFAVQKKYAFADHVDYLPFDSKKKATKFVKIVNPHLAIIVKYEFWWNLLQTLQNCQVPLILISGVFRSEQYFFRWYGQQFLSILRKFTHLFVQDKNSEAILLQHQCTNVEVAGDTRIDRVLSIAKDSKENAILETFKGGQKLFIAGSTWAKDESILLQLLASLPADWKLLIAPHEINKNGIEAVLLNRNIPFETYTGFQNKQCKVMILNTIGNLSASYKYADLVYIGGGFNDGIHNILEPMAFGKSVLFGPNYQKFHEAVATLGTGANYVVENEQQLKEKFQQWNQSPELRVACSAKIQQFMSANTGASQLIARRIGNLVSREKVE